MTKRQARTAAFAVAAIVAIVIAIKGGAAKTLAIGALAILGAVAGIDLPL